MDLLAVETFLAAFALKRGWRRAPLALVVLPCLVDASESALARLLGAWLGQAFEPAGTGPALAHALALLGLASTCAVAPAARAGLVAWLRARLPRRDARPLYQI